MSKKILGLVSLVGIMAIALAGCGKESAPATSTDTSTSKSEVVETIVDTASEIVEDAVVDTESTTSEDVLTGADESSLNARDELASEYFGTYTLNDFATMEVDEDGYVMIDTGDSKFVGYVYKNASGTYLVACEKGVDISLGNFLYVCGDPVTIDMNTWTATCDVDLTKRYTMVEIRDNYPDLVEWGIPEKPVKVVYTGSMDKSLCVKTQMGIILPINGEFAYDGQTYTNVVGYIQGEYDEGTCYEVQFVGDNGFLKYATLYWTDNNDYLVWYIGDTPENQP